MAVFDSGLLRLHVEEWGGDGVHLSVSCLWRRSRPFCDAFYEMKTSKSRRGKQVASLSNFVLGGVGSQMLNDIHAAKLRDERAAVYQAHSRVQGLLTASKSLNQYTLTVTLKEPSHESLD